MSSLDELIYIERDCTDLIMRYGQALDEWRPELMKGLFDKDAVWEIAGGPTLTGEIAIVAFWDKALAEKRPSICARPGIRFPMLRSRTRQTSPNLNSFVPALPPKPKKPVAR